ncbi:MAG: DNA translocase FtsK 4TM domain-containing protein, partial [Acidobacteria bacterium]|nr:DNA translocase FtsK 4TM domain-containing protein [Acidobacteriota bacterium]
MKPLRFVTTPTRNRRLNELIGLAVLVGGGLLALALVSYTPTDPSWNTVGGYATGRPAHNWTGIVGAFISDATLQLLGIAAFAIPLSLMRLGYCWMRSRPAGSPVAKFAGLAIWIFFGPSMFALLPGH